MHKTKVKNRNLLFSILILVFTAIETGSHSYIKDKYFCFFILVQGCSSIHK